MYTRAHLQLISVRVMKKKIVIILGILLSFISCQKGFEQIKDLEVIEPQVKDNIYAISSDQAMTNLLEFLKSDSSQTKSNDIRVIGSITPISYNKIATKSGITDLECETLLYVANFENNQGYAILAGDTRIGEPIVAITDEGYLSDAIVYTAVELATQERTYYEGYPLDGPGFYTTPETGDEVFMNPNTVILYDETVMDTLVGNFRIYDENPEVLTTRLCVSYALNEVAGYSSRGSTIGGGDDDNLPNDDPEQNPPFDNTPHGPQPLKPWTETIISPWSTTQLHEPILALYMNWHQDRPFNNLYPLRKNKGSGEDEVERTPAPAGCFPLAIAKILAHYEIDEKYNDKTINWEELKKDFNSTLGAESAENLLRDISKGCLCWYFAEGTFTFPGNALLYMRNHGLPNAHNNEYSFEGVTGMIDNDKPLIIYSVPGKDVASSHSWNIDGYKIKQRSITTTTYQGSNVLESSTEIETISMVHCDFGWGGKCNGYYVSNVFKLDDPAAELDSIRYNVSTYYNNYIHIITY